MCMSCLFGDFNVATCMELGPLCKNIRLSHRISNTNATEIIVQMQYIISYLKNCERVWKIGMLTHDIGLPFYSVACYNTFQLNACN